MIDKGLLKGMQRACLQILQSLNGCMLFPPHSTVSTMHDGTGLPSISTVHATSAFVASYFCACKV